MGEAVDDMTDVEEASNVDNEYSAQPLAFSMVDMSSVQAEIRRFSVFSFPAQSPSAIANSTLCDASR